MQFLNPCNDVAFKKIFGSEEHKRVTISFINSVLNLVGDATIKDVQFLNTEQKRLLEGKKDNILDILCIDQVNNKYIIEVQVAGVKEFDKRITFYAAKTYALQLDSAQTYQRLEPVMAIAVLDFILFPNKSDYKSNHLILDEKTYENDLKDLVFAFIELPKFNKEEHELVTDTDRWTYFLKNIYKQDAIPDSLNNSAFKEACQAANRLTWNVDELETYHNAIIKKADDKGMIEFAREEGIAEGKIETVKGFLRLNKFNIADIAQATGLTIDEIEKIKKDL